MSKERLRMQVRVVQTVFRAEVKRLALIPGTTEREDKLRELSSRSMAILEHVRAELDDSAGWHRDVLALAREVEAEVQTAGNDGGL